MAKKLRKGSWQAAAIQQLTVDAAPTKSRHFPKACECEHVSHDAACGVLPVYWTLTDYGTFAVCAACDAADHISLKKGN